MFGRGRVGVGDDAGELGRMLRARCRNRRGRCGRRRRLRHRQREAAMAMMSADGLVIAMARRAIEDRGDLRTATGRGDVDVVRAVKRSREQIDNRDQHGKQPAPVARTAGSSGLAVREHDITLVAVCARPSTGLGIVSTRNIVTSQEQLPQQHAGCESFSLADDDRTWGGQCFDGRRASRPGNLPASAVAPDRSGDCRMGPSRR